MAETDEFVVAGYYGILKAQARRGKSPMHKAKKVILEIFKILTKVILTEHFYIKIVNNSTLAGLF